MRVLLFGTCLVDTFFPEAGEATVRLLRRFGAEPVFPKGQTCCGQPAFNAGYESQARAAALAARHPTRFLPFAGGAD